MSIPLIEYLVAIGAAVVLWVAGRRWPDKVAPIGKVRLKRYIYLRQYLLKQLSEL